MSHMPYSHYRPYHQGIGNIRYNRTSGSGWRICNMLVTIDNMLRKRNMLGYDARNKHRCSVLLQIVDMLQESNNR